LFWEFSGGNVAENMVHQIAWIMGALDLPLPSAAYMSGGVFSEKDGREVPDTIAVTLDFPKDIVVTWQSSFSNKHYDMADRILGSDGTLEHRFEEALEYWPEKTNRPDGESKKGSSNNKNHMANWIDCIRSRATPNAPPEIGYRSALAVHMANLSYRNKKRITLEEARAITPEY
jgi:predicted dehydrogenase